MNFNEPLLGDMGVDLGGGRILMAEHFLDSPQIGATFQKVTGKRVAQAVGSHALLDAGLTGIPFQQFPKTLPCHRFSCAGDK